MASPIKFDLLEHQEEFIFSDAPYVCLDGGYGNGKSTAGYIKVALQCQDFPGTKCAIFRTSLADLKRSTLEEWKELFGDYGNYNHNSNTFTFDNGSKVLFHQLTDLNKLRNHNLSAALIEQAEEASEEAFWYIMGRLRRTDASRRWLGCLSNPEGHDWIWRLFIDKDIPSLDMDMSEEEKELGIDSPGADDFHYVSASSWANADNLPEEYLQSLAAMPENLKQKYVEGSRDVLEGSVYSMLNPDVHRIPGFEIPEEWPKWLTLDYGSTKPTAGLWVTQDYDDRIYVYREHYKKKDDDGKDWLISQHAEALRDYETEVAYPPCPYNEHVKSRYIDPQCTAKTREKNGRKMSIIEEFSEFGVNFEPWRRANSRKNKLAQINRVGELFKPQPEYEHPVTGESPAPRLYFFESVENTWEEHRQYHWEDEEEVPVKENDHTCDALRGWCGEKLMGPDQQMVAPPGSFEYYQKQIKRKKRRKNNSRKKLRI